MSKERVWMERNAGTAEEPQWEKYLPKTVADAIYASDADGETRKIMDLVREEIQKVVGTAPEAFDTLQEIAAYIEEHEEVAAALQQAITDKADKVHTHADATQSAAGFMSAEDKTKLDGIASGANKYVHPTGAGNNHIPAGGASGQVLTYKASGEAQWANPQKTEYGEATTDAAGLMSAEDKEKLDGIAEGANKYTHPTTSGNKHIPIGGASGKILGWKADGEAQWVDDKNTTYSPATSETNGLMSAADKEKLDGIAEGANKYTHPSSHAASMITQDAAHRFVSDAEKQTWADKYTKNEVDNKLSALETKIDWKEAVETFADIATTYPEPEEGWTVSVNDTDTVYRYNGTDWVGISANTVPLATSSVDGKMSKADKAKLDGIATGANKYVHPSTSGNKHIPTGGGTGKILGWKADGEAQWVDDKNTTYSPATSETNGLMSAADKEKLDGIAAGANNYTHPTTAGNKHIPTGGSAGKILGWKASGEAQWVDDKNTTYNKATSSSDGLMAKEDKTKLDTLPTITFGAEYPDNAPANSIHFLAE